MLYLLHLTIPAGTIGRNAACHYLGYTAESGLDRRMAQHRSGRGARLTAWEMRQGGKLLLALTIAGGTRSMERRLKRRGHLSEICPLCNTLLDVIGQPVTADQLSHRLKHSRAPSRRPASASGGVSLLGSPTGRCGLSPQPTPPENGTGSHVDMAPIATTPGGGATCATAPLAPAESTSAAGTRQQQS